MVSQAVHERDELKCNICMGHPRNSVLTLCGHMFCWSCLHGWLQHQDKPCPVCRLMVKEGGINPVYGCQSGSSSRVQGVVPPRPNPPTMQAGQPTRSSHPNGMSVSSYVNEVPSGQASIMQDLRLHSLRSRAQADFQAIRASNPSSSVGWIAQASDEFARDFDPLRAVPGQESVIPDIHVFVFRVLVPQGEVFPAVNDFRSSWLPYYEAQNPQLDTYDHYNDFVAAWAGHFHRAWDRAGRPAGSPSTN